MQLKTKAIALATALLAAASVAPASAVVTAGDNADVFLSLCSLIRLAERSVSGGPETASELAAYTEMQQLNSSLSPATWRKNFAKKGPDNKRPDYNAGTGVVDEIRKRRWPHWKDAEDKLEQADAVNNKLKSAGLMTPTDGDKERLRIAIQPLLEEADSIVNKLENPTPDLEIIKPDSIKKILTDAAFGSGITVPDKLTDNVLAGKAPASANRDDICGKTTASATADSAAAFMYCICAAEGSDNAGNLKICHSQQAATGIRKTTMTDSASWVKALIKQCPEGSKEELQPESLEAAVNQLQTKLKPGASGLYYGKFAANGCTGESNSGACVFYKDSAAGDIGKIKEPAWITQMKLAAKQLRANANAIRNRQVLTARLEELRRQALKAQAQLILAAKTNQQQGHSKASGADTKTIESIKKQCEALEKATDCKTKTECKWEGSEASEGKHCKLKEKKWKEKPKQEQKTRRRRNARGKERKNANLRIANGRAKLEKIPLL
uniref:Variant surface glycoprotein 1051 n=1 Tax=Trypanosoma brucei TaxID=5691 RepID=M4SZ73_9TRYP|nr:variant surface glycoprotein 1051 [Trypanosoma brucei]